MGFSASKISLVDFEDPKQQLQNEDIYESLNNSENFKKTEPSGLIEWESKSSLNIINIVTDGKPIRIGDKFFELPGSTTLSFPSTGTNGLDSGSLELLETVDNTGEGYHIFIMGSTESAEVAYIISKNIVPVMPDVFDVFRRIGWVATFLDTSDNKVSLHAISGQFNGKMMRFQYRSTISLKRVTDFAGSASGRVDDNTNGAQNVNLNPFIPPIDGSLNGTKALVDLYIFNDSAKDVFFAPFSSTSTSDLLRSDNTIYVTMPFNVDKTSEGVTSSVSGREQPKIVYEYFKNPGARGLEIYVRGYTEYF